MRLAHPSLTPAFSVTSAAAGCWCDYPHGKRVIVDVDFPGLGPGETTGHGHEVDVQIFSRDDPESRVHGFHTLRNGEGRWESQVNTTGGEEPCWIHANFKVRAHPDESWQVALKEGSGTETEWRGVFRWYKRYLVYKPVNRPGGGWDWVGYYEGQYVTLAYVHARVE
jgi:hypothetical protein